jgi:hypothetical protein
MHERYYFAADIFSLLYGLWVPQGWLVAAALQMVSTLSYLPFLFNLNPVPSWFLAVAMYGIILRVGFQLWQPLEKSSQDTVLADALSDETTPSGDTVERPPGHGNNNKLCAP